MLSRKVKSRIYFLIIFFILAGTVIFLGSILHFSLLICLSALLRGKAQREERRLLIKHPQYSSYLKNTPAIFKNFPFLDWRI